MSKHSLPRLTGAVVTLLTFVVISIGPTVPFGVAYMAKAQPECQTFKETNKTVCGQFLAYWNTYGGLAQQGFPITDEFIELSETDGKTYTVQYFERAVFERHPENQPPYDVLLSLLGVLEYKRQWSGPYYPIQKANADSPLFFKETGKTIGGPFRRYWQQNGGLPQHGYPITDEFEERSPLDNKLYKVQYFERAVFEYHPENQPPYDVLLSHLGKFRYHTRYNSGVSPTPTAKTDRVDCVNVSRLKGTVIAQGTNTEPTTPARLKTYQVEEVRLQSAVTCTVPFPDPANNRLNYRDFAFDRYWRLSILADNAVYEGEIPLGVWLNDALIGHAVGTGDRYPTHIYDLTYLQEGATISIGGIVRGPQYYLPERLQFNKSP